MVIEMEFRAKMTLGSSKSIQGNKASSENRSVGREGEAPSDVTTLPLEG